MSKKKRNNAANTANILRAAAKKETANAQDKQIMPAPNANENSAANDTLL